MRNSRCLRIALTLGGLLLGWSALAADAQAGLLGLFGCHHRHSEPVCCEPVYCEPCCTCECDPCGECVTYCGEMGCGRGRRARRCCRMPRRMRRGCGTCSPCCSVCPSYCGCCDVSSVSCGCEVCSPCHVGCGRRAMRMARRCNRRAIRACRGSVCYSGCESYVSCDASCCADSGCPCHVGRGRRMRVRGCGGRRVRGGHACCGVASCDGCPSHCDAGMCGGGMRRMRGRRHCHYCANDAAGYGCSTEQSCPTCETHAAPAAQSPAHEHAVQPQPVNPQDPPLPPPQNLPTPPADAPSAFRMLPRI